MSGFSDTSIASVATAKDAEDGIPKRRRGDSRQGRFHRREARHAWAFLAPVVVLFAAVTLYPTLDSLRLSFYTTKPFRPREFSGLENYSRMLEDPLFWQSLKVTAYWALVVVPAVVLLGLVLASALHNTWLRGKGLWRTIYFAPVMTSMVAAAFTWKWLFEPTSGVVNYALRTLGVDHPPDWLASPTWALPAVMIVAVWQQLGFSMILFLTGLQTIPAHLYEAARLDGASGWSIFRHLTIPLLNPTIVLVSVMTLINAFRVFTLPYAMTSTGLGQTSPGGPLDSTRVFVFHIYDVAFGRNDFGYGAANAVVLLMLTMVVSVIQLRLVQRPFEY